MATDAWRAIFHHLAVLTLLGAAPSTEETARVRRLCQRSLVLFAAIPICAALIERGIGV